MLFPFPATPFLRSLGGLRLAKIHLNNALDNIGTTITRWDKDVSRDGILELKNLSTIPMLIGEIAHNVLLRLPSYSEMP